MNSRLKTRTANACDVGRSTSCGEAATDPWRDGLRILRAPALVHASNALTEGKRRPPMMATARRA